MNTTARWEGNTLMVRWFGGSEDEAAFLIKKDRGCPVEKPFRVIFDGNDDTLILDYAEKPDANVVLAAIRAWQI